MSYVDDRSSRAGARASAVSSCAAATAPGPAPPGGGDLLSDVLQAVRLRGALFFQWEVSSPFATPVPAGDRFASVLLPGARQIVSYHLVVEGACWGGRLGAAPHRLEAGDVLLVPRGDAYVIGSSPDGCRRAILAEAPAVEFFRRMAAGELPSVIRDGGGGPDTARLICGFLGCDLRPFNPVVAALPATVRLRVPASVSADRLRGLVEYALAESREPSPGSSCTLVRVSELMFVEVLRRCLADLDHGPGGWLAGLGDPVVGRCLALLHRRPTEPWTLPDLAAAVGSSRTRLAARFAALVGEPPMRYLTRWRLQLAAGLLENPDLTVAAVARRVGYASAAAFSRAFTRIAGVSPSEWRRHTTASAADSGPA